MDKKKFKRIYKELFSKYTIMVQNLENQERKQKCMNVLGDIHILQKEKITFYIGLFCYSFHITLSQSFILTLIK